MKNNIPILISVVLIAADIVLLRTVLQKRGQAATCIDNNAKLEKEISKLEACKPYPNQKNLDLEKQKFANCIADYDVYSAREKFPDLPFLNEKMPANEIDFYFLVMSYVKSLQDCAEKSQVKIPDNCAFGFDMYVQKDTVPSQQILGGLYEESRISAQLIASLFQSNDHGLTLISFTRESIRDGSSLTDNGAGTFDKYTCMRVKEIKSYLFALEFECYTSVLRKFFNAIQEYNFPVVIRGFEAISDNNANAVTVTSPIRVKLLLEWVFPRQKVTEQKCEEAK